jgi:hypothetical protein
MRDRALIASVEREGVRHMWRDSMACPCFFMLEVKGMRPMWITCGQRETAWYARHTFTLCDASSSIASAISAKHLIHMCGGLSVNHARRLVNDP